jgi:hypothetical protein
MDDILITVLLCSTSAYSSDYRNEVSKMSTKIVLLRGRLKDTVFISFFLTARRISLYD